MALIRPIPTSGDKTYTLLSSYSGTAAQSYTFNKDHDLVLLIVAGGVSANYNYTGSGTVVATFDNTSADPNIKTRLIKDVKQGDTLTNMSYGYQLIDIS